MFVPKIADILTDDEFSDLFQFKKAEADGIFLNLINQGLPEEEKIVE